MFNDDYINIYIDEEVPCMVNEWKRFVPSYLFRKYILKLLELYEANYQEYDKLMLLADTRELHVLSPNDIEWVAKEINPRYVALGISHEAFVAPEDTFGETVVIDYISESKSSGAFTTRMFSDITEAKAWLKEVQAGLPAN